MSLDMQAMDADAAWRKLVFPEDYVNPKPQPRYHLCVIGAGPAGLVASIAAAGLGARVALIERHAMGGDCLNVGCIPSKALLEFTHEHRGAANFAPAFDWLRRVRASIAPHDSVERYTNAGVDVFLGAAKFRDRGSVEVAGERVHARRFVIATGARAAIPPIRGLDTVDALTNETVFDLRERPARLAIVGAGALGCELALVFARLGTEVALFESAARALPSDHREAGRLVTEALEAAGVSLSVGAQISEVNALSNGEVALDVGDRIHTASRLLVAAGRRANTDDLGLDVAGVELTESGLVAVDDKLRTSNRRIFAAGDVCTPLQFTHHADAHARIVVQNALFLATARTRGLLVPHCTYTQPEVAQIGPLAETLEQRGIAFDAWRVSFAELDRARAAGDTRGFAEVLTAAGSDKILGATIVGDDAGEQLAAVCLAMTNGLGLGRLAATILPYPTRAEYLKRLADQYNRTRLTTTVSRIMERWFRWTA